MLTFLIEFQRLTGCISCLPSLCLVTLSGNITGTVEPQSDGPKQTKGKAQTQLKPQQEKKEEPSTQAVTQKKKKQKRVREELSAEAKKELKKKKADGFDEGRPDKKHPGTIGFFSKADSKEKKKKKTRRGGKKRREQAADPDVIAHQMEMYSNGMGNKMRF